MERLNRHLTEEMRVLEAYEPTTKFHDIAFARYEMDLHFDGATEDTASAMQALYTTSPLTITKKTKSGEKEIDLVPLIREIAVTCQSDGNIHVCAVLTAGETNHVNPEMLITAAKERLGILSGDPAKESYSILRTNVYFDDGVTEFR